MYIDNDDFSVWMQKLYAKLEELCKDVRDDSAESVPCVAL